MAVTPDVPFPTWEAIGTGLDLSFPTTMVAPIGGDFTNSAFSVVAVIALNSLVETKLIELNAGGNSTPFSLQLFQNATTGVWSIHVIHTQQIIPIHKLATIAKYTPAVPLQGNEVLHIAYTYVRAQVNIPDRLVLYVNGIEIYSTEAVSTNVAPVPTQFIVSTVLLGAIRIYSYARSAAQVTQDYLYASSTTTTTLSEVEDIYISGISPYELGGTFNTQDNSLVFTTNTTGSFKLLNADVTSSLPVDPNTSLPRAGFGYWGSTSSFSGDNFISVKTIIGISTAVVLIPDNTDNSFGDIQVTQLTISLASTHGASVNDSAQVQGLLMPGSFTGSNTPNGVRVIETVIDTTSFTVLLDDVLPVDPIIDTEVANIKFTYPSTFTDISTIPGSELNPKVTYTNVTQGDEYTVRVKGTNNSGTDSKWIEDSLVIGSDTVKPSPIYFIARPTFYGIEAEFNFSLNILGVEDPLAHTETNLAYIELVGCASDIDRADGTTDPGVFLAGVREIVPIVISTNASEITTVLGSISLRAFEDRFLWARLVTTSGVVSDWYPEDSGVAAERDLLANPPVSIGYGPVRTTSGNANNLAPVNSGSTTSVDTTTANQEGPAGVSGTEGIY